ncbi:MAG: 30S ribosome-binding factor RbfA [Gammaproteobacteria bacterium]|nr:30S ribosome-binding factor RbfA [Gammaproteobacteria bacterium]
MARDFERTRRVGEQIQRELSELIRREVKDPRLGMVTITAVDVSKDFAIARVYLTVLGKEREAANADVEVLNQAAGFLRRELGKHIRLRFTPKLQFLYDESIESGAHLASLIESVSTTDKSSDE